MSGSANELPPLNLPPGDDGSKLDRAASLGLSKDGAANRIITPKTDAVPSRPTDALVGGLTDSFAATEPTLALDFLTTRP